MSEPFDELRKLAWAATQGHWIAVGRVVENEDDTLPDICSTIDRPALDDSDDQQCADAAYIAAANPQFITLMIDEIKGLGEAVDRLKSENYELHQKLKKFQGSQVGASKITPEIEAQVHALHAEGKSFRDIARVLRISKTTAHKLATGIYPGTKRMNVESLAVQDLACTAPDQSQRVPEPQAGASGPATAENGSKAPESKGA